MTLLLTILTAASLILALSRKPPHSLRCYLWCQLLYIPPVMGAAWSYGIWSPAYALIYVLATLPILGCIALITWESIEDRPYRLRPLALSFLLALTLARIAFVGLGRAATYYDAINLGLGLFLAWMGALIGFSAPYARRWDLSLILGLFWLAQAMSAFGWLLFLNERLNFLVDPALGILAFLLIALRLHRPRNHGCLRA